MLHGSKSPVRLRLVEDALAILVSNRLRDLGIGVREGARRCELPPAQLDHVLHSRSKRPRPEVLEALERGLGISYDSAALAAYGRLSAIDPETPDDTTLFEDGSPPTDSKVAWNPARRSQKATAST